MVNLVNRVVNVMRSDQSSHSRRSFIAGIRRGLVTAAAGAALLAIILQPVELNAQSAGPSAKIRLSLQPGNAQPPFIAADMFGFFKDAGLEVEELRFNSGAAMFAAAKSGSVDILEMGLGAVMLGSSQGIPIKAIMTSGEFSRTNVLVAKPEFKSIKDLKGKRIASVTGSTSHLGFVTALKQAGLNLEDVQYLNMDPAAMVPAFRAGDIDAAWIWSAWQDRLVDAGGVRVMSNSDAGIRTPSTVAVRTDWASQNVDTLQRFLSALDRAYKVMNTPGSQRDQVIKKWASMSGISEETAKGIIDRTGYPALKQQVTDEDPLSLTKGFPTDMSAGFMLALKTNMDYLIAAGRLLAPVRPEAVVDPEPLTRYVKSIR